MESIISTLNGATPKILLSLPSNRTDVWLVNQDFRKFKLSKNDLSILNNEEIAQSTRFRFEEHRQQYLLTRFLVRNLLSAYQETPSPEKWVFFNNAYGRPFIDPTVCALPLFFSISHTKGMIAIAVSSIEYMGIDVERHDSNIDLIDFPSRCFSEHEVQHLLLLPEDEKKAGFYRLWTLKESYLKAIGKGLSVPLDSFTIEISNDGKIDIDHAIKKHFPLLRWQFENCSLNRNCSFSLCFGLMPGTKNHMTMYKEILPNWRYIERCNTKNSAQGFAK